MAKRFLPVWHSGDARVSVRPSTLPNWRSPWLYRGETVRLRELDLADILIRELTGVELADIHDEYRHALEALIEAKLAGGEVEALPQPPAARPADLMAVLEASVRAARDGES